jgi:hypothetical protein
MILENECLFIFLRRNEGLQPSSNVGSADTYNELGISSLNEKLLVLLLKRPPPLPPIPARDEVRFNKRIIRSRATYYQKANISTFLLIFYSFSCLQVINRTD